MPVRQALASGRSEELERLAIEMYARTLPDYVTCPIGTRL